MGRVRHALGVGTWAPAALICWDVIAIKTLLAVSAVLRAVDYGTGSSTGRIEQAGPASLWVVLCATTGTLIAAGMLARVHWSVFTGHFLGAFTYAALAVGAMQRAFEQTPPDGWRGGSALLIIAFLHGVLALRSGQRPIPRSREAPVETVVAPTEV